MISRRPAFRAAANIIPTQHPTPSTTTTPLLPHHQTRCLHARIPPPPIPSPTAFVPDAPTFLTLIGRNLSAHASKFPTWDSLFRLTSPQLKNLGIEPPRARKYLLRWRDKFRNGEFGIGGDLKIVKDGRGHVRVVDVPVGRTEGNFVFGPRATLTRQPGTVKRIVNVEEGGGNASVTISQEEARRRERVKGVQLRASHTIAGPHVELIKGSAGMAAMVKVKEGMWEHRRGHKIDGGERRKAEVRAKRRAADRKAGKA